MSETVLVERDGAIATVTLSSPGRLNALDRTMWAIDRKSTRLNSSH